jgi:hypothetical protein
MDTKLSLMKIVLRIVSGQLLAACCRRWSQFSVHQLAINN